MNEVEMEHTMTEDDEQNRAKMKDMQIAQKIASYAGMVLRDRHLNVSDDVWQAANTVTDTTKLLDTASIRKILIDQLNQHLEAQRELLLASDSQEVLVQWIIDFQTKWEKKIAAQSQKKFDISVKILTIMEETLLAVEGILQQHDISQPDVMQVVKETWSGMEKDDKYSNEREAYMRLMFRNDVLGPYLCRVAGKLLQKQLVCNRSGSYSSTKQRNDVTQERDEALMQLTLFLQRDNQQNVIDFVNSLKHDEIRICLLNHCKDS
tara:strand:+ start:130 stop:921 length:792 start_codon:yes stop_codon:yes gene_type:complete